MAPSSDEASAAVVLLTALSPIPVLYATFGRPHSLLFAWLMWSTVLVLTATVALASTGGAISFAAVDRRLPRAHCRRDSGM